MKFSVKWLREHLEFDQDYKSLTKKLNELGLEVESMVNPLDKLKDFKVVEILNVKKHPNADKLNLCEVYYDSKKIQIVCGAKNARKGLKSVLAPIGTYLPENENGEFIKIKQSNIRGEESFGMLCSGKELCLSDESEGIIELNPDCIVGKSITNYIDEEEIVIEVSITPNRVDCAGVNGIARDLSAAGFGKVKTNDFSINKEEFESKISIHNELKKTSCPQFYGRIIKDVSNGDSPEWIKKRFKSTDIKIISSLVDVTNFLTIDSCRPLHVFDLDKIHGDLRIRLSKKGETFKGLDGINYNLDDGMIVICDESGIISLAGILGGLSTACDDKTKNILIESAYFDPNSIAITGRKLNIMSDARYRFERGIDPLSTINGLNSATKMICENCRGKVGSIVFDGIQKNNEILIEIDISYINEYLGTELEQDFIIRKLSNLGCKVVINKNKLNVTPPSWRGDIKIKEDLIEEVARMYGYEKISEKPMQVKLLSRDTITSQSQSIRKKIARLLVSRDFMELITWSFVDKKWEEKINPGKKPILLNNPISEELGCLRSNLYINLLAAIKKNQNRGGKNLKCFEIGPVFYGSEPGEQSLAVLGIISGHKFSKDWLENEREVDIYDAKAILYNILEYLGFKGNNLKISQEKKPHLYPKKNGVIYIGNTEIASFGLIHPHVKNLFELKTNLAAFEINLSSLLNFVQTQKKTKKSLKKEIYQTSTRDFSFVVNKDIFASQIIESVKRSEKEIIKSINVFDSYEGKELGENKKAIALEVVLSSEKKTLSDSEIDKVTEIIISNVSKKCGGKLR